MNQLIKRSTHHLKEVNLIIYVFFNPGVPEFLTVGK